MHIGKQGVPDVGITFVYMHMSLELYPFRTRSIDERAVVVQAYCKFLQSLCRSFFFVYLFVSRPFDRTPSF